MGIKNSFLKTDTQTYLPSHLAVPGPTLPGSYKLRIGPQGHWLKGFLRKVRSHWAQDHKDHGFCRLLDSKRRLQ